jgi:two-component system response regulator RegA
MSEQIPQRILLCDDDSVFRRRLKRSLSQLGFEVFEAENAEDALQAQRDYAPDSAVVDLRMPGQSGLWLVGELRKCNPEIAIVVLTGFGSISTALEAMRCGAINYLTKPVSAEQLIASFSPTSVSSETPPPMPSLAEIEAEYVQRVLSECDGNVSRSAKVLGVHRRSLQRKLRGSP